ncbi:hypothetical protein EJ997_00020 [Flaviflexus ciconiae]|uniref:Uncharacterized protein n=1 Tax=Flaviflexus ciconiae TaxID=2496867 RepID=A0A3Q9G268_9ACTO|nr:hypothetical protein [Flaviflexus ciconiae]AZQ75944.1 hypothetical protein EJ997_00020 [Flaviflexus ciconiae]
MKVVAVRTPGSVLSALEIRGDLSMVERRSSTMGSGLSVAVASARSEIVLSCRSHGDQPATIVTAPTDNPTSLDGQILAIGTTRFKAVEVDGDRLWMKPIRRASFRPVMWCGLFLGSCLAQMTSSREFQTVYRMRGQ